MIYQDGLDHLSFPITVTSEVTSNVTATRDIGM